MIAVLNDRNQTIKNHGSINSNGKVVVSVTFESKYNANLATMARLKLYYNNCLTKLDKF